MKNSVTTNKGYQSIVLEVEVPFIGTSVRVPVRTHRPFSEVLESSVLTSIVAIFYDRYRPLLLKAGFVERDIVLVTHEDSVDFYYVAGYKSTSFRVSIVNNRIDLSHVSEQVRKEIRSYRVGKYYYRFNAVAHAYQQENPADYNALNAYYARSNKLRTLFYKAQSEAATSFNVVFQG